MTKNKLAKLKYYIDENIKKEFIYKLKLMIKAFILFIKKKNRCLKLCINYQKLNTLTVKDRYFISLILKILKCLKQAVIFIKLNF